MAEDKLKQEIFYMVSLTSKYDFTKMEVVEGILRLENDRRILDSVFGRRFKSKIFDIAAGVSVDNKCVICGQPADNKVICQHCMSTVSTSDYAKSKIKIEETEAKPKKNITGKKVLQVAGVVCLTLILLFQLWILGLWISIPNRNPSEKPKNSSYEVAAVSSQEEALQQLQMDFPEEEGYTVTFVRQDTDFAGRFSLDVGACCAEVEDALTEDQLYDYYLNEEVYVFHISYLVDHSAKLGIAEVNGQGVILIQGTFNDGRRSDSFYRFR